MKKQIGLTLIEFLIVIAILGIIAVVAIPAISRYDLAVPTFGIGYVVTDLATNTSYQLRGRESFKIEDSTIRFIPSYRSPPYNKEDSITLNYPWTLKPG